MLMKTKLLLTFISAFLLCSCKQVAQSVIESGVDDLNDRCPIKLGKVDVLKKVEFKNNAICFYVTEEEQDINFGSFTPEQKEKAERDMDFRRGTVGMCLNNETVQEELNNLTDAMAEEVDLKFKVFIKGATSQSVIKAELSWREIQELKVDATEW